MPNKKYIEQMFDSIAGDYDALNHLMSLGVDKTWRRRSLRYIIDPRVRQNILDVACGTGDYSIAIARKMAPGGTLTGFDLSEGMLAVMRRKLSEETLPVEVRVEKGDGESLPFEDNSFDRVTIAFGIRNFSDRKAALKEFLRVLKVGGSLVILELSVPENRLIRSLYMLYFKHLMPRIGGVVSGDKKAYRYLPASVIAFPSRKEWMAIMRECGFSGVIHKSYTFGLCRLYVGYKIVAQEPQTK